MAQRWNAATFSEQIQRAVALGQFQNPTGCEHIRRLPCGQLLRAAVAEELRHRRISKSQTENGGGPRRRPAPATRIGRAPFGARTPTDQEPDRPAGNARAHTRHSHPSASGFDRLAPNSPHSCAPAPPDRNRWPRRRPRAHEETWRKGGTRPPFPSRYKERSRSANSKIQQGASTSEGCPAASCCERLLPKSSATAGSQSPKQKTAAGLGVGQHQRPGLAARRSAPARPRIKSPIAQPEMPERTHATATPRPAVSIGSRRTVPIAARRRRRIETAGRGAALARTRKRGAKVERGHLFRADTKSGRARPIPKSNRVRAHPKAALRPAVASGCCRRAPPPPDLKVPNRKRRRASASASTSDQDWPRAVRRPHAHGSRARSPSRKCQSAHTPQPPLGQRFRSARAEQSP